MEITNAFEKLSQHLSNRFLTGEEKVEILEKAYDLASTYPILGIGRSRIVYEFDADRVLKFSFLEAQSMQNSLELAASSSDMPQFYAIYAQYYTGFNNLGHSVEKVKKTLNDYFGGEVPIAKTVSFSENSNELVLQERVHEIVSDCYALPEEVREKWGEFQFRFDGLQAGFTSSCELKAFDL